MTDSPELQGEKTAPPLLSQIRRWPVFELKASQLRDQLSQEALPGFELATVSLSSKRG